MANHLANIVAYFDTRVSVYLVQFDDDIQWLALLRSSRGGNFEIIGKEGADAERT